MHSRPNLIRLFARNQATIHFDKAVIGNHVDGYSALNPPDAERRLAAQRVRRRIQGERCRLLFQQAYDLRHEINGIAAALGAWAGATTGGRLSLDWLAIGDFALIPASLVAWLGIGIVAVLATLGPQSEKEVRR